MWKVSGESCGLSAMAGSREDLRESRGAAFLFCRLLLFCKNFGATRLRYGARRSFDKNCWAPFYARTEWKPAKCLRSLDRFQICMDSATFLTKVAGVHSMRAQNGNRKDFRKNNRSAHIAASARDSAKKRAASNHIWAPLGFYKVLSVSVHGWPAVRFRKKDAAASHG